MMTGMKSLGLHVVISPLVLLTISFFVLAVARDIKEQALKSFGNIIAMLLWAVAILVLVAQIYMASPGCSYMKKMGKYGHKGMGYKRHMMKK
jgi:succinate-acetate transporter protein